MQLSHLLEELLLKHENVFVPQLGQLSFKNMTADIEGATFVPAKRTLTLDVFSSNDDGLLTAAISRKFEISLDAAKEKRNQLIEEELSAIKSNNSLVLKGIGKIIHKNGFQAQELGVAGIPSDFFGLNSIEASSVNTSGNSLYDFDSKKIDVTPAINEVQEIQKTIDNPVQPVKFIVEEDHTPTEIKTIDDLFPVEQVEKYQEEKNPIDATSQVISLDSLIPREETPSEVKIEKEEIQEVETEFAIENETVSSWVEEIEASHQQESEVLEENIQEFHEEEADEILLAESEMQEKETILESIYEEETEKIVESEEEEEAPIEPIKYIDTVENENVKKRLSRYDDDLDYVITPSKSDEDSNRGGWFKVAALLFLFFGLAFLIPWIYATMQCQKFIGLKPLWNANCKTIAAEKPKDSVITPIAQTTDSLSKDTSNKLVVVPTEEVDKKPENVINNTTPAKKETPAPILSNETKKTTTKETPKNVASNAPKKEVKATENPSKENVAKKPKEEAPAKLPKGATVTYKKGLTYVCFGTFNNVNTANRLRSELRSLEVLTETVFIDGTYRVVIPYVNRKYAEKSAEDFPNTIIFE
jgi:hypothetical protein